ncbi:hypothetical protein RCH06_000631 [Polaromonas sp. CG_9.5]|uniref:hypothetical protein n=1 Tax=Polaromonas sp. CG_9.5 TaxID=3071705 RepID=UPI002DFE397E|nr:hypothetical protein [Polaromonas sp. CG_9.5]
MNVALAGLTAREETALMMLVGKTLPDFECGAVPVGRKEPLPPADLYVLDLAGRGLARWTQEAQESLLESLNGAPAVLVAPAFDETWLALEASRMKSPSLVMLRKPYGIEAMRAALLKAAPTVPVRSAWVAPRLPAKVRAPAITAAPAPAAPAVRFITAPVAAMAKAPVPVKAPAPAATVEIAPLSVNEFQTRLAALPASAPKLFLHKLADALALKQPFEVRVTFLNRLILSPDAQWAASNTALSVLQGLCQSDALAADMSIDTLDGMDALTRAQRLDMPVQPLGAFLGTLMYQRLA